MREMSLGKAMILAGCYIVAGLLVSAALVYWRAPIQRGPNGEWKFFWLIPTSRVRNYLLTLFLPPALFILAWVVARVSK
jgi:hypothetical protein